MDSMAENNNYGLQWWANSEHGGRRVQDGQNVRWLDTDKYPVNPILGDNPEAGYMYRWQSLRDYVYPEIMEARTDLIVNLARLKALEISEPGAKPQSAATAVIGDTTIFVFLEGTIDFAQEIERLEKEIAKIDGELQTAAKKLANASFLSKAPAEVVNKVRSRSETLTAKSDKLRATLTKIRSFNV